MEIISAWELYLWTRLDGFNSLIGIVFTISLIALAVSFIYFILSAVGIKTNYDFAQEFSSERYKSEYLEKAAKCKAGKQVMLGAIKYASIAVICSGIISVAIPSQKDMAMIYVVPKIANNENIQNEASDIYTMAKDALKEYLPVKEESK